MKGKEGGRKDELVSIKIHRVWVGGIISILFKYQLTYLSSEDRQKSCHSGAQDAAETLNTLSSKIRMKWITEEGVWLAVVSLCKEL